MTATVTAHDLVKRDVLGEYYAALDTKHFTSAGIGSIFTEVATPEELLELATAQRGDLTGDDRDLLVSLGADPEAFKTGVRYLAVRTRGQLGIVRSENLAGDTPVKVTATKPGCPVSLSVSADIAAASRSVEIATVIIGDAPEATGLTGEVLFTAHPGLPTPSPHTAEEDPYAGFAGTETTLAVIRAIHGGDLWLQLHS